MFTHSRVILLAVKKNKSVIVLLLVSNQCVYSSLKSRGLTAWLGSRPQAGPGTALPLRFMNILVENCQLFKMSFKSAKLILEYCEIVAFNFEVWIGENMCTSCERISGIYGIKTTTFFRASRISDVYGIPCRGFFIELGLDKR
jgi:hypothetical protein